MNTILVLIDSLNRHYLSMYGGTWVKTPNLDRFASRAWRMDNHFVGSLPCMPARREIFSGRKELLWRPWGPLEPTDYRLPRLLEAAGCTTAIVTDHYHYWEEAANGYIQSFTSAELVRGHEFDFWKTPDPADEPVPAWVEAIDRWRPGQGRRYYANVKGFESETDYFPAKVMTGAVQWLRTNAQKQPFFLQVESFDVHEPFDVPEPYASMYGDGAARDRFTAWPPYQDVERMAEYFAQALPEEISFLRSQYAGKLAMVDHWFGTLLDTIDAMQLWDDTMIIVTTDHGHDLGEHRKLAKSYPHYDTHAHIPLLVYHPDYPANGRTITQLTATVDLFATVLEAMQADIPDSAPIDSRSLIPLLQGNTANWRESWLYGTFGHGLCCTDGQWTLFKSPVSQEPLFLYSTLLFQSLLTDSINQPVASGFFIPGVPYPQWKIPIRFGILSREDFLFNRREDPSQDNNRWQDEPAQRQRMLDMLHTLMAAEHAPAEQYVRLGLV
ncbi:MAG: sulfatase [Anaerolineae bacterium]|nr:sulfatase [Anaerolineae bacterium]